MKLRIRRVFDEVVFEADSGSGFSLVRALKLEQLPQMLGVGVASASAIGAWPVTVRTEP